MRWSDLCYTQNSGITGEKEKAPTLMYAVIAFLVVWIGAAKLRNRDIEQLACSF
jgi:hypothetical protein